MCERNINIFMFQWLLNRFGNVFMCQLNGLQFVLIMAFCMSGAKPLISFRPQNINLNKNVIFISTSITPTDWRCIRKFDQRVCRNILWPSYIYIYTYIYIFLVYADSVSQSTFATVSFTEWRALFNGISVYWSIKSGEYKDRRFQSLEYERCFISKLLIWSVSLSTAVIVFVATHISDGPSILA